MASEKATELANRLGLTTGVSAVTAKGAEAAGLISTGGPALTLADWAVIITIIGGVLYAANQLMALVDRIRAKRAAANAEG